MPCTVTRARAGAPRREARGSSGADGKITSARVDDDFFRLWLETGSAPDFAAPVLMHLSEGFTE